MSKIEQIVLFSFVISIFNQYFYSERYKNDMLLLNYKCI